MYKHIPNAPRPSLAEAKHILAQLGWTPSEGSWEDEGGRVFAFSQESYPGTYGAAAASVSWATTGWLALPPRKPRGVHFV